KNIEPQHATTQRQIIDNDQTTRKFTGISMTRVNYAVLDDMGFQGAIIPHQSVKVCHMYQRQVALCSHMDRISRVPPRWVVLQKDFRQLTLIGRKHLVLVVFVISS